MTDNDLTGSSAFGEESAPQPVLDPESGPSTADEDPGYLTETGQAVGEDGSVVPIIGGLPAVEGSAWDIGAPLADRGTGLADQQGSAQSQASDAGATPPEGNA